MFPALTVTSLAPLVVPSKTISTGLQPYVHNKGEINANGMPDEAVGGVTSITIPSPKNMNTLAWADPETGIYYRLQSVLDMETMGRIAQSAE